MDSTDIRSRSCEFVDAALTLACSTRRRFAKLPKPTEEVAPGESITSTTGRKMTALILVVALLPLDSVQEFFCVNRSGLTNASKSRGA